MSKPVQLDKEVSEMLSALAWVAASLGAVLVCALPAILT